jgi:hypothetical protein
VHWLAELGDYAADPKRSARSQPERARRIVQPGRGRYVTQAWWSCSPRGRVQLLPMTFVDTISVYDAKREAMAATAGAL